jgi:hypothetical protein
MQQIADWLEKLGLGQYAQRFAENDIDTSVLPHLTDENLKVLGISLGHRVKLLPRPAKAKSCCSPGKLVSASRGSRLHFWKS